MVFQIDVDNVGYNGFTKRDIGNRCADGLKIYELAIFKTKKALNNFIKHGIR